MAVLFTYEEEKRIMNNKKYYTVKELPDTQRPYEKCETLGAESLSDAELLAVIIKSGTRNERSIDLASRILNANENNGLLNLHSLSLHELMNFSGIGRVKAIQLKCIAELTKRMARMTRHTGESFVSPEIIATYYMEDMRNLERENLMIVMLDSKSRRINDLIISSGTVNSSIASSRDIFYQSLKCGAVSIILVHNHPSGDPTPSKEDYYVTTKIKEGGELIGIPLLDHIIIGDNCYFSMKENGNI